MHSKNADASAKSGSAPPFSFFATQARASYPTLGPWRKSWGDGRRRRGRRPMASAERGRRGRNRNPFFADGRRVIARIWQRTQTMADARQFENSRCTAGGHCHHRWQNCTPTLPPALAKPSSHGRVRTSCIDSAEECCREGQKARQAVGVKRRVGCAGSSLLPVSRIPVLTYSWLSDSSPRAALLNSSMRRVRSISAAITDSSGSTVR
jgi:hypothetical protein